MINNNDLKTRCTFFLLLFLYCLQGNAQLKSVPNALSLGILLPAGNFSDTHFMGLGVDYSPTRHRFDIYNKKYFSFTYNAGVAYYFGKKETVGSYTYQYPGYFFIHGSGGILYHPVQKTGFVLFGGPGIGIYNGHSRFTWGIKMEIQHYFSRKYGIAPGLVWMKESGARPLWSLGLKGIIAF